MGEITLAFTGDIMFGGRISATDETAYIRPFQYVSDEIDCDFLCVDLETPLCEECTPIDRKGPVVNSPPESTVGLQALGADVVGLNNNHVTDCGDRGVQATQETLYEAGIRTFGIGRTESEAARPVVVERVGSECAIVGYTTNEENVEARIATGEQFGGAYYETDTICEQVNHLQSNHEVVCVVLHWGHENHMYPSPDQIKKAREIVNAGADAIIGHHPHVVQGFERWEGSPIFYSLGNFFFPDYQLPDGRLHRWHTENNIGFVPQLTFRNESLAEMSLLFVRNEDTVLEKVEQHSLPFEFDTLCNRISSNDQYHKFWDEYKKKRLRTLRRRHLQRRVNELGVRGLIRRLNRERVARYLKVLFRSP